MSWNLSKERPIYIQLVEQIKLQILSGHYRPGERFPSVRELATEAAVNPNTMQKALAELEREGFVYSKRTSGRFVTDNKELIENERKNLVKDNVKKTLDTLINLGYTNEEILNLVEEILREDNNE